MEEENNGIDKEVIREHFKVILEKGLKIDSNDVNFKDTPDRVARSYAEIFKGLRHTKEDVEVLFSKCFPTKYKGIVMEKEITVFSMCPHHFLPVRYEVAVGYIPTNCGIGLSKLTRVVELLAKKPVLQETFTDEIVDLIESHMEPMGVICVVKGAHYCMQMRGVRQKDVVTITSAVRGVFKEKAEMEQKFLDMIGEI
jgi:GTP cyclohydrolase IA